MKILFANLLILGMLCFLAACGCGQSEATTLPSDTTTQSTTQGLQVTPEPPALPEVPKESLPQLPLPPESQPDYTVPIHPPVTEPEKEFS